MGWVGHGGSGIWRVKDGRGGIPHADLQETPEGQPSRDLHVAHTKCGQLTHLPRQPNADTTPLSAAWFSKCLNMRAARLKLCVRESLKLLVTKCRVEPHPQEILCCPSVRGA
ncbi:hypothetical protein Cadr_000020210 [Camelus dromedarius]|uniref:Uncharacterized protein n=1 Tax=Camelus dromedarius TaxID=9838 RepID=A0A5N4CZ01_CAMDR|nr:hypothetical protein Cadr_000020210 [Camelus dromedarius]